jgi:hypothetical protein
VDGLPGQGTAVSVEFTPLIVTDAIRCLFRATNLLLWYAPLGEGTQLTQLWSASRESPSGRTELHCQPASSGSPAPTLEEQEEAVAQPVEALIQTVTGDTDLAARLSVLGDLGSHAQQDVRVRETLADLADHDNSPQIRDAASTMLGEIP